MLLINNSKFTFLSCRSTIQIPILCSLHCTTPQSEPISSPFSHTIEPIKFHKIQLHFFIPYQLEPTANVCFHVFKSSEKPTLAKACWLRTAWRKCFHCYELPDFFPQLLCSECAEKLSGCSSARKKKKKLSSALADASGERRDDEENAICAPVCKSGKLERSTNMQLVVRSARSFNWKRMPTSTLK